MAVILHAVPLSGVCRKGRPSPVPQVRARPEEMRCVGSKRTRELGRDMLLAASIVKFSVPKAHGRNRTVSAENHSALCSPLPLVSSISASRNRAHCGTRQAKKAGGAFVRLSLRWCRELAGGRIPHLLLPLRRFEFLSFPAARRNAPKEKKRSKRKGPL